MNRDDPNYGAFAWATVALGILAMIFYGIGADQVREFNTACTNNGSLLLECYGERLKP